MTTVGAALKAATARLGDAGIEGAGRDARWLLAHAMGISPDRLVARRDDELSDDAAGRFKAYLAQRVLRVPVSHLTGERAFYGRTFRVTGDVLDPRPETETLIELALSEPFARVLDLGTGSGAILVTLLAERPEARGVGTDLSDKAVLVAGENARSHGVAGRIVLPVSDWWADVGGTYDLIVSNPPYLTAAEWNAAAPELRHEPAMALTDGADGLTAYRAIADGALAHLTPGGRCLVEIGATQGVAVGAIFEAAGFADVEVHPDLDGRDRVVSGRAPWA